MKKPDKKMARRAGRTLLRLGMLLSGLWLAAAAQAQPYTLTYTTNADHTLTVSGYTADDAEAVVIPDSEGGMPVVSIGDYAFTYSYSPTSVTIPSSVTSIGNHAFDHCLNLASIVIPDSVTNIGDYVFLTCYSLTDVTLPGSLASISDGMFRGCGSLTSVAIPAGVTHIGSEAFNGCGLTNVILPASVTGISITAFLNCGNLTNIEVDLQSLQYSSVAGVLFDKNQTTLLQCPGGIGGSYAIPRSHPKSMNTLG